MDKLIPNMQNSKVDPEIGSQRATAAWEGAKQNVEQHCTWLFPLKQILCFLCDSLKKFTQFGTACTHIFVVFHLLSLRPHLIKIPTNFNTYLHQSQD